MLKRLYVATFILTLIGLNQVTLTAESKFVPAGSIQDAYEYRLLATNKTSTMQKELNDAADGGFRFESIMGGETAFGGSEAVVIMSRRVSSSPSKRYEYKLLATSKTSTMQKELQQAGDAGFEYKGQTVFSSTFGGREVVLILERDPEVKPISYEYKLLATSKTSTMQKELQQVANMGYRFVGVTVASSAFGGKEVIVITRKLIP
jgi:hypothetical protein